MGVRNEDIRILFLWFSILSFLWFLQSTARQTWAPTENTLVLHIVCEILPELEMQSPNGIAPPPLVTPGPLCSTIPSTICNECQTFILLFLTEGNFDRSAMKSALCFDSQTGKDWSFVRDKSNQRTIEWRRGRSDSGLKGGRESGQRPNLQRYFDRGWSESLWREVHSMKLAISQPSRWKLLLAERFRILQNSSSVLAHELILSGEKSTRKIANEKSWMKHCYSGNQTWASKREDRSKYDIFSHCCHPLFLVADRWQRGKKGEQKTKEQWHFSPLSILRLYITEVIIQFWHQRPLRNLRTALEGKIASFSKLSAKWLLHHSSYRRTSSRFATGAKSQK